MVPRSGRDGVPTTHIAVRHDLLHPTMPAAAVAKLRARLRTSLGGVDLVKYVLQIIIIVLSVPFFFFHLAIFLFFLLSHFFFVLNLCFSRIRILPPLEDRLYRALLLESVAVLDPFPVGMHVQILDALLDEIPIVRKFCFFPFFHFRTS